MKLVYLLLASILTVAMAADKPPMPKLPANTFKYQCKVPDWLVSLPPELNKDYKNCLNNRYKPTRALAQMVLKQFVSKKAELVSIKIEGAFFAQVYRINYTIGQNKKSMVCNESLTYCLDGKQVVKRRK